MATSLQEPRSGVPYFAYGSNMLTRRLQERCPSARKIAVATVRGYKLAFDKRSWKDGTGKCHLLGTDSLEDLVWGVAYSIEEIDFARLDTFEGCGKGYDVSRVWAEADGPKQPFEAFTFVADPAFIDSALTPFGWYLALVVAGAEEHGLPERYVRQLRQLPSTEDPESSRDEAARKLIAPF